MKIEKIEKDIVAEIKVVKFEVAKLEVGDLIRANVKTADSSVPYYGVVLEPMCNDFNNLNEDEPVAKVRQLSNGETFIWSKHAFNSFEFVIHLDGYAFK